MQLLGVLVHLTLEIEVLYWYYYLGQLTSLSLMKDLHISISYLNNPDS
jgi:hypothetical protein